MPSVVSQAGNEKATYSWFADGSKFSVLTPEGDGYSYIGSLIYASNGGTLQIESTAFAGGRINLATSTSGALTQDIQYHHTDHLGSVRAITNQSGETVEQNAYYPFGSRHTFGNTYAQTTNRFKYNGKEEQTTGNLGLLDYGARMYDSKIARWFVQDPLAEQMYGVTPYRFSLNNPVNIVDQFGLSDYFDFNGLYLGSDGSDKDLIRIITQENWEKIRIKNDDGSITFNEELGDELSTLFSQAPLPNDAILNIFDNYNTTNLPIELKAGDSALMEFNSYPLGNGKYDIKIYVFYEVFKNEDLIDNANNIINSFIHEGAHYKLYRKCGHMQYASIPSHLRERMAISTQMKHDSYIKTSSAYKQIINIYLQKNRK